MTGLPEPVRQLLEAIVEALDLPLAATTVEDDRARDVLLDRRALYVAITCSSIVRCADGMTIKDLTHDVELLRKHIEDKPVSYRTFQPRQQDGDGQ